MAWNVVEIAPIRLDLEVGIDEFGSIDELIFTRKAPSSGFEGSGFDSPRFIVFGSG